MFDDVRLDVAASGGPLLFDISPAMLTGCTMNSSVNSSLCSLASASTYEDTPAALRRVLAPWVSRGEDPFFALGPGARVVIKPNWVTDMNPTGAGLGCLVTHSSLIAAVAEYAAAAMGGVGRVTIGDAPVQSCNFERLQRLSRIEHYLAPLRKRWPRLDIQIEDWRLTTTSGERHLGVATQLTRGPSVISHLTVDLGARSFLEERSDRAQDFRVTCYRPSLMRAHHSMGRHEYLVATSALDADLFVNLPKLKTHKKAGVTGALKNLVGINGHKEFLPHHIKGAPEQRGDAFPEGSISQRLFEAYYDFHWEHFGRLPWPVIAAAERIVNHAEPLVAHRSGGTAFGSWPGNDTIWRMTLDLNQLLYAWAERRPKNLFTIVDALVVGEGDGPLSPTSRWLGYLLGGTNPAAVDLVGAYLLGYEPMALPTVCHALSHPRSIFRFDHTSVEVLVSGTDGVSRRALGDLVGIDARRPPGWEAVATSRAPAGIPLRT